MSEYLAIFTCYTQKLDGKAWENTGVPTNLETNSVQAGPIQISLGQNPGFAEHGTPSGPSIILTRGTDMIDPDFMVITTRNMSDTDPIVEEFTIGKDYFLPGPDKPAAFSGLRPGDALDVMVGDNTRYHVSVSAPSTLENPDHPFTP